MGSQLCITVFMKTFTTKFADLAGICLNYLLRFYDRSFKTSMKMNPEKCLDVDQQINTRQFRLKDVN